MGIVKSKRIKDATASAGDVRKGKVFYNNDGKQSGVWEPKVTDYTFDSTALVSDVLKGKIFYNKSGKQTGTLEQRCFEMTIPVNTPIDSKTATVNAFDLVATHENIYDLATLLDKNSNINKSVYLVYTSTSTKYNNFKLVKNYSLKVKGIISDYILIINNVALQLSPERNDYGVCIKSSYGAIGVEYDGTYSTVKLYMLNKVDIEFNIKLIKMR